MMLPIYRYGSMSVNEARMNAGFSLAQTLELLEISSSTWYRWCNASAPGWSLRLLECYAGHLDHLGWRGWQIQRGKLFTYDLSHHYYWTKGDLLVHAANLSKAAVPITIRQSANGETNASLSVVVRPTT